MGLFSHRIFSYKRVTEGQSQRGGFLQKEWLRPTDRAAGADADADADAGRDDNARRRPHAIISHWTDWIDAS